MRTIKVILCGIAKMENDYLREWVEWYKHIGVDKIILYDNNDKNGERFDDVIGDYIQSGYVGVVDFRGRTICQLDAYNDCYQHLSNQYDWFLFLDIDEFLQIDRMPFRRKIKPWLQQIKFNKYNAIKVCWKIMSDSGNVRVIDGNYSRKRFTIPSPKDGKDQMFSKTFIRGGMKVEYKNSVHYPNGIKGALCNVMGTPETPSNKMDKRRALWKKAVILHYRYRTIEEYILNKKVRGYPDHDKEYSNKYICVEKFYKYNKRTEEKDRFVKQLMK